MKRKSKGSAASSLAAQSRRRPWVWAAPALALLIGLVYWSSLHGQFLFDDLSLIVQDTSIQSLKNVPRMMFGQAYRPVRTVSYALNYAIAGFDPSGAEPPVAWHAVNILLHWANAVLLFLLAARLSQNSRIAAVAAALFALHPANTAAVSYISGRKDLLAGLFVLIALLAYLKFHRTAHAIWLSATLASFALAVLSKEVGVVFPVLPLVLETLDAGPALGASFSGELRRRAANAVGVLRRRWILWTALAVAAFVFLLYAQFVTGASRKIGWWGGAFGWNIATSAQLFAHYIKQIFLPHPLLGDYSGASYLVATGLTPRLLLSLGACLAFSALWLWCVARLPRAAFGLAWFAVALIPVLHFIPFHELAADHFLYLPSMGWALAVAVLLERYVLRLETRRVLGAGVLVILLTASGALVVARNRDYRTSKAFWESVLAVTPDAPRANNNLAQEYTTLGQQTGNRDHHVRAVELYKKAASADPDVGVYWINLGAAYYYLGQFDPMREVLAKGVRLAPGDFTGQSNYAVALMRVGERVKSEGDRQQAAALFAEAEKSYQNAIALKPHIGLGGVYFNLARLYFFQERWDDALSAATRSLELEPASNTDWLRGQIFEKKGNTSEALGAYLNSINRNLANLAPYEALSQLKQNQGDRAAAIETYLYALRFNPDSDYVHLQLGRLYQQVGNIEKSRHHFEQARRFKNQGSGASGSGVRESAWAVGSGAVNV
ncbi:MAG: hypothetical protein ACR2L2_08585 [Acidobacteriota bacterium]